MESLAGSSVHDFLSHDSTHGSFPVLMLLLPLLKLIEDNMALNREITLVMAWSWLCSIVENPETLCFVWLTINSQNFPNDVRYALMFPGQDFLVSRRVMTQSFQTSVPPFLTVEHVHPFLLGATSLEFGGHDGYAIWLDFLVYSCQKYFRGSWRRTLKAVSCPLWYHGTSLVFWTRLMSSRCCCPHFPTLHHHLCQNFHHAGIHFLRNVSLHLQLLYGLVLMKKPCFLLTLCFSDLELFEMGFQHLTFFAWWSWS